MPSSCPQQHGHTEPPNTGLLQIPSLLCTPAQRPAPALGLNRAATPHLPRLRFLMDTSLGLPPSEAERLHGHSWGRQCYKRRVVIHTSLHTLRYSIKKLKISFICRCGIHSNIFLPKELKTFTAIFLCASWEGPNKDFYLALPTKLKA